jgi:hypothetical protein
MKLFFGYVLWAFLFNELRFNRDSNTRWILQVSELTNGFQFYLPLVILCSFDYLLNNNRLLRFRKSKVIRQTLFLTMLSLFWFTCINFSVSSSNDLPAYQKMFAQSKPIFDSEFWQSMQSTDLGFNFLVGVARSLGLEFWQFFSLVSLFSLLGILNFFFRFSSNPLLTSSLFFSSYFLLFQLNQIRAGLAIGIFLMGYALLDSRKYVRAAVFILASGFFHFSAIILVLIALIVKFSKWLKYKTLFLSLLGCVFF